LRIINADHQDLECVLASAVSKIFGDHIDDNSLLNPSYG
jgi:citrate lyase gamma subunit